MKELTPEEKGKIIAKEKYQTWADEHELEVKIISILNIESAHRAGARVSDRRAAIYQKAGESRRELGFTDMMAFYVSDMPFVMEDRLKRDGMSVAEDELKLLRSVNEGIWLATGHSTDNVRILYRFDLD